MQKITKCLFLIIAITWLASCNKAEVNVDAQWLEDNLGQSSQIVGGQLIKKGQSIINSVVLIYILPDSGVPQTCTGSFITKKHILTAAHCVSDIQNMSVTQGLDPLNESEMKLFKIEKVVRHEKYDENKNTDRNDIAIITVDTEDSEIRPLTLPNKNANAMLFSKLNSFVILKSLGYGISQELSETPDYKLRQVNLKLASQSTPNEWMAEQSSGHGVCFGDSGGPVIIQKNGVSTLVGVASGVQENCHSKSIFMNVFFYLAWISVHTRTPSI